MEKQGLFLKLNESISDPDLSMPVANSFIFEARKEGNGSGVTAFAYTTTGNADLRIAGGEFFSDENATQSLGTYAMIIGVGIVWIKAIKDTARIVCRNADKITGLGNAMAVLSKPQTGNAQNAPYHVFNIESFPVNLVYMEGGFGRNIYNGNFRTFIERCTSLVSLGLGSEYVPDDRYSSDLYGDMTGSTALHRIELFTTNGLRVKDPGKLIFSTASIGAYYNVLNTGSVVGNIAQLRNAVISLETQPDVIIAGLYGDLRTLPPNIQFLSFVQSIPNSNITYSGRQWRDDLASLLLDAVPLGSFQMDLILNDLSEISWSAPRILRLRGTRTSASDSSIAKLQAKGVTVTINA